MFYWPVLQNSLNSFTQFSSFCSSINNNKRYNYNAATNNIVHQYRPVVNNHISGNRIVDYICGETSRLRSLACRYILTIRISSRASNSHYLDPLNSHRITLSHVFASLLPLLYFLSSGLTVPYSMCGLVARRTVHFTGVLS